VAVLLPPVWSAYGNNQAVKMRTSHLTANFLQSIYDFSASMRITIHDILTGKDSSFGTTYYPPMYSNYRTIPVIEFDLESPLTPYHLKRVGLYHETLSRSPGLHTSRLVVMLGLVAVTSDPGCSTPLPDNFIKKSIGVGMYVRRIMQDSGQFVTIFYYFIDGDTVPKTCTVVVALSASEEAEVARGSVFLGQGNLFSNGFQVGSLNLYRYSVEYAYSGVGGMFTAAASDTCLSPTDPAALLFQGKYPSDPTRTRSILCSPQYIPIIPIGKCMSLNAGSEGCLHSPTTPCYKCKSGYYLSSGTCLACSANCKRCNSTDCLFCDDKYVVAKDANGIKYCKPFSDLVQLSL